MHTPKTMRPAVDLQIPRAFYSKTKPLSSFVQARNVEMAQRVRTLNSRASARPVSGQEGDEEEAVHHDSIALGEAKTVLEEALQKLVDGSSKPKVEEEIVEGEEEEVLGATSIPTFENAKDRNEWFLERAKADIVRLRPNQGQGQAGCDLAKMLPSEAAREMDIIRRDGEEGMELLRARIDTRARKLAARAGEGQYGSMAIVQRNKRQSAAFHTDAEREKRLAMERQRRERAKANFEKKQQDKHDWHRKLMQSVANKSDQANMAIAKRKEDAIRDRVLQRTSKFMALSAASVRIALLASIIPASRRNRKVMARKTKAVNTLVKFYRIKFAMIHFRNYKEANRKLRLQFKKFLPMWRMRRTVKIAKLIVDFTQSISGAGGTAAAIRAYRSKMTGMQRSIRRYLKWKHGILHHWLAMYMDRHAELLNEWEEKRREKFKKAAKEGIELDANGDPHGLPERLEVGIGDDIATQQFINVFTTRRNAQRERLVVYQQALAVFSGECQQRMRMRLAQKMIQGAKFDLEKTLEEEDKSGKPPLIAPIRPEFNMEMPQTQLDQMITFGSHVMSDKEELEISLTAKVIARLRFKHAPKLPPAAPEEKSAEAEHDVAQPAAAEAPTADHADAEPHGDGAEAEADVPATTSVPPHGEPESQDAQEAKEE